MFRELEKFYRTKVHARKALKKKSKPLFKFLQLCLVFYLCLILMVILLIEIYWTICFVFICLIALDMILARFVNEGLLHNLFRWVRASEFKLWKQVIGKRKMTIKNFNSYVRKYKMKLLRDFLEKNHIRNDYDVIINYLQTKRQVNLTIYTVTLGAIFVTISAFVATFFEQIFEVETVFSILGQIDSSGIALILQYLSKSLIIFGLGLKISIITSPFICALLYFKFLLLKSDLLIEFLTEIHLKKIQC